MRRLQPLAALVAIFAITLVVVGCTPPAEPTPGITNDPTVGKETEKTPETTKSDL